ncbi:cold shock domain-containing protein [Rhodobacter capsulatus]|uniref:cold shock domain-containing protein n=1 Tax=Rhodobacter capsulatus TaxID=1061 RepID=UPI0040251E46
MSPDPEFRSTKERLTGTVKWFTAEKGFGFIQPDGQDKDVFVHLSSLQKAGLNVLSEGQRLSFEMVADRMGKLSAGFPVLVQHGDDYPLEHRVDEFQDQSPEEQLPRFNLDPDCQLVFQESSNEAYESTRIVSIFEVVLREVSQGRLDILGGIRGEAFEDFTAELYAREGYEVFKCGRWNSPDGGIDFLVRKRMPIGIRTPPSIVQCKASKRLLTANPIREINGVRDALGAPKGIVVTNSAFTKPALRELNKLYLQIEVRDYINLVASLRKILGLSLH